MNYLQTSCNNLILKLKLHKKKLKLMEKYNFKKRLNNQTTHLLRKLQEDEELFKNVDFENRSKLYKQFNDSIEIYLSNLTSNLKNNFNFIHGYEHGSNFDRDIKYHKFKNGFESLLLLSGYKKLLNEKSKTFKSISINQSNDNIWSHGKIDKIYNAKKSSDELKQYKEKFSIFLRINYTAIRLFNKILEKTNIKGNSKNIIHSNILLYSDTLSKNNHLTLRLYKNLEHEFLPLVLSNCKYKMNSKFKVWFNYSLATSAGLGLTQCVLRYAEYLVPYYSYLNVVSCTSFLSVASLFILHQKNCVNLLEKSIHLEKNDLYCIQHYVFDEISIVAGKMLLLECLLIYLSILKLQPIQPKLNYEKPEYSQVKQENSVKDFFNQHTPLGYGVVKHEITNSVNIWLQSKFSISQIISIDRSLNLLKKLDLIHTNSQGEFSVIPVQQVIGKLNIFKNNLLLSNTNDYIV
ncbi:hypothetical protein A3Q56_06343 [Intoshia linei]|uniref:Uncharacterized protein n=1 Tax=Intoshia linei TaxID=1819745 RepID=A0A177AVT2_9BILA|nr:hypothetical protein A3Q56_06343 [Intoshia linei]